MSDEEDLVESDLPDLTDEDKKVLADVGDELDKSVMFVGVTKHMWRGQHLVRGALVSIGKTELANELITNPRWNMIPPEWRKRFSNIDTQIRHVLDKARAKMTKLKFPLKGVYIIPRLRWPEVSKQLDHIENEMLKPLAKRFADAFPDIRAELAKKISDLDVWKLVERQLPQTPADIVNRFYIEKVPVPIRLSDAGLEAWSEATAEEMGTMVRESAQPFAEMVAQGLVASLQDELFEAIDGLQAKIEEAGTVKATHINKLKDAFSKLSAFNFVPTPELNKKITTVSTLLAKADPTALNSSITHKTTDLSTKLTTALKAVRNQAEADITITSVYSGGGRRIRV